MDWWQIALVVITSLGLIFGGKPAWKAVWKRIIRKASRGLKEMSEAFMSQALAGQKAAEVLEKLSDDIGSVSKEEITEVWEAIQEVGIQWGDVIAWARDVFYSFHK